MAVGPHPISVNVSTGALEFSDGVGRWVNPVHGGVAVTSQTFTVGRVLLAQFTLAQARTVDAIAYVVGTASAGNVIVGIVGPVPSATDTALGLPVVVQSASTAQGTAQQDQTVTFTPTLLPAGVYYAALEGDNATGTYMRQGNQSQAPALGQFYDRAGGYGALTSPTPAVTGTGNAIPGLRIRLA